jgi:precorrin-6B methylase 2
VNARLLPALWIALLFAAVACARGDAPQGSSAEQPRPADPAEPAEPAEPDEALAAPGEPIDDGDVDDGLTEMRAPDIHFVPTPQKVVDRMLELAKVSKDDVVYDLGCGDGRIVITAAKKYGARAIGFDIDPEMVREARRNVKEAGVEDLVTIEQADVFTLDLTPASVITIYLLASLNVKLIPQLQKLKKGARIVSHDFDMQGVQHDHFETLEVGNDSHDIYFWNAPIKVKKKR